MSDLVRAALGGQPLLPRLDLRPELLAQLRQRRGALPLGSVLRLPGAEGRRVRGLGLLFRRERRTVRRRFQSKVSVRDGNFVSAKRNHGGKVRNEMAVVSRRFQSLKQHEEMMQEMISKSQSRRSST